ncbi:hypothetical protein HPA18_04530 [Streptococcus suis]|uniref:hypothetical protein n=1 Tax=Streptococcus suis TaxID=1307 RepID=UPI00041B65BE|nr:hypothetical protein [Streptococcus suis]NQN36212.1 hypothetical protein [Streptococcus suis]
MLKTKTMIVFGRLGKQSLFYDSETQKVYLSQQEYAPRRISIWLGITLAMLLCILLNNIEKIRFFETNNQNILLYSVLVFVLHFVIALWIKDEYLGIPLEEFQDWKNEEWKKALQRETKAVVSIPLVIIVSVWLGGAYSIRFLLDFSAENLLFSLFFIGIADITVFHSNFLRRFRANRLLRVRQM